MTTNQTLWLDQGGLRVGANQLTTSGSGVGVGTSSIYGSFTAGNGAVFFGTVGMGITSVTTGYTTEINGNLKVGGIVASNTVNLNIQTTNYSLAAYDSGGVVLVNSGSAVVITVPTQAQGYRTMITRQGAGTVTLTGSGVTLQSRTGLTAITVQYGSASVLFVSTTVAIVDGSI